MLFLPKTVVSAIKNREAVKRRVKILLERLADQS